MNLTTQWTCSCGTTNGLRNSNCYKCGKNIPAHICQKIYWEELFIQRKRFRDQNILKHKNFWEKHSKTLVSGSKLCKILSFVFVVLFTVGLVIMREQIRIEDITYRFSTVGTVVTDRTETSDIQLREFEEDLFPSKRSFESELDNLEKEFVDFCNLLEQRAEQIKNKKEEILNYVS